MRPLTQDEALYLVKENTVHGYVGFIRSGPDGYEVCIELNNKRWVGFQRDETLINSNDWTQGGWLWKPVSSFSDNVHEPILPTPMFDLEDMELAEILIDEMKG